MKIKRLGHDLTPPILWKLLANYKNSIFLTAHKTLGIKQITEPTGLDLLNRSNNKHKIIYLHLHKCAGTSIRKTLQRYPDFVCCVARPGNFPSRLSRDYIDDSIWNNSFKFTFVRNPYSRVVSVYKMFRNYNFRGSGFENFEEFIDFIRWCDVDSHHVDHEVPLTSFSGRIENIIHHCSSFHNPKYRIDELDFIGRVETINEDMKYVAEKLGVEEVNLPFLNSSKGSNYREYYSDKTRKIIAQKYHQDIERFEYKF